MGEETFLAKIMRGWRLTVYEPIRESLDLEIGDLLRVTIHLVKKRKEPEIDQAKGIKTFETKLFGRGRVTIPSDIRTDLDLVDGTKIKLLLVEIVEKAPTSEPPETEDEQSIKEPPVEAESEDVSEPEEVEEKSSKLPPPVPEGEQEYVDPCIHGLDFPCQDLVICKKCKLYLKKFSWASIDCTWTGWKPIGWEEETEEESIEEEDFVMRLCNCSSEEVRHSKRKMSRGLVRYVCTQCKKKVTLKEPEEEKENE